MFDENLLYLVRGAAPELTDTGLERVKEYISIACPKQGGQLQLERFMLRSALRNMDEIRVLTTSKGKWIKRFRATLMKDFPVLDRDELRTEWYKDWEARLGSMIGEYCTTSEIYLRVVDKINWRSGDFGDEGSCFWGDRSNALEILNESPNNGAIQVWCKDSIPDEADSYYRGTGRCWWQYAKRQNILVLWNRYGGTRLATIGESVRQLLGYEFSIIDVGIHGVENDNESLVYVNGDCCVLTNSSYSGSYQLTFPSKILEGLLEEEANYCECCDERYRGDGFYVQGSNICERCWEDLAESCEQCGTSVWGERDRNSYILGQEHLHYFCSDRHMNNWLTRNDFMICEECTEVCGTSDVNPDTNICYDCVPKEEEDDE
jgi:hypothetical protein